MFFPTQKFAELFNSQKIQLNSFTTPFSKTDYLRMSSLRGARVPLLLICKDPAV